MSDLETLLSAYRDATRCEAAVWTRDDGGMLHLEASVPPGGVHSTWTPPLPTGPPGGPPTTVESSGGPVLIAAVAGPQFAVLAVGPCGVPSELSLAQHLSFLRPVVSQFLQAALEVEHAANELAERYEEINLLYTITEILGRTVSLDEASATILREISETVGARRGSILVYDRVTATLQAAAVLGADALDIPPISIDDDCSVSARVFREHRTTLADEEGASCEAEASYHRGTMLSVPIMWTSPNGANEPLGVVNLSDRRSAQPFSAGDQKLMTAIATQIGTAIENARLVRASLSQQRLVRELELAHDLQMRLLPRTEVVAPEATVAARVVPAESVGGDFYNLFRLGNGRTGVMIGDVSSHGYRAALIMALALSASAIHAQSSSDPATALGALLATLGDELTSTEMFITAFYAVIDREAGTLRYANTGHPHAFVVTDDGDVVRLGAIDPPLGMVETRPTARTRLWQPERDLLVLFTDGVSDARDRAARRLGEQPVLDVVVANRHAAPSVILDRVFEVLEEHIGGEIQRDDLALVVLRT
ncbi:MAG: GAF domain-containing SpoIIE family protein phosphatase [Gemmatimonadaceae bacterium]